MKTVHEVARLAGVSVRTLHHYDSIGLLRPACISESGYRLYDTGELQRLQLILIFRELRFSLKEIKSILNAPDFDLNRTLAGQIDLLLMERSRLDNLISFARKIQKTGAISMDFTPFDKTQIETYTAEAKSRWGNTDAWKEFEQKSKGKSKQAQTDIAADLMALFASLGRLRHLPPESSEAQQAVARIQAFITENYYACTNEIFASLGKMYAAGGSMTENIDAAGGPGTAEFAARAIEILCGSK